MKRTGLYLVFSLLVTIAYSQHSLIPTPVKYESGNGVFVFDSQCGIETKTAEPLVTAALERFKSSMSRRGIQLTTGSSFAKPISIQLNTKENAEIGKEGYRLTIAAGRIDIQANQAAGILYALNTLEQLVGYPDAGKPHSVSGCAITDYPRFGWRGLMLDVSRHFFTKEEVKQYLDVMATYKLNVLHWHLTDDNGWRLEIKSLPRLTSVGAWRVQRYGTFGNRKDPQPGEPTPYGGFYTHEDVREIIAYAAERNITVVPEIDVPGHSMAALAAYPELSCRKEPKMVNPGTAFSEWYGNGKFKMLIENTLNPADENVYAFLDKVFTEVAQLFPSSYIHVGGDEAYHGFWEADENCKALMKKNNLKDGHELQSYFMKRVEKIVSQKGKKMIGWDEILEGGLAPGATVMSWRGMKGGIEAAKMGHEVVMSPTTYAYLDYTQGDRSVEFPIYASLSLRTTYSFEPVPEGVNPKLILGGQGNLWTEQIPTLRHAFYMTYPRALAIAETVWSPKEKKNYNQFLARLENHFVYFDNQGLNISRAVYDPIVVAKMDGEKLICELSCDIEGATIHYTIDNTFPDQWSPKYEKPVAIPEGNLALKVITLKDGKPLGRMLSINREELARRAGRK